MSATAILPVVKKTPVVRAMPSPGRLAWRRFCSRPAAVLGLIPACLFFAVLQRYLVAGLSAGAVKG